MRLAADLIRTFTLFFLICSTLALWVIFFLTVMNGSRLTLNTNLHGEEVVEIVWGSIGLSAVAMIAFPDLIRRAAQLLEGGLNKIAKSNNFKTEQQNKKRLNKNE